MGLLAELDGNDLRKRMGAGTMENMSQQDMQKVLEGLRVLMEWLNRGKEPQIIHKADSSMDHLPEVLEVNEVANVLNVSKYTAYELCKRPDFPAVRIGRRILVRKEKMIAWMDQQAGC